MVIVFFFGDAHACRFFVDPTLAIVCSCKGEVEIGEGCEYLRQKQGGLVSPVEGGWKKAGQGFN